MATSGYSAAKCPSGKRPLRRAGSRRHHAHAGKAPSERIGLERGGLRGAILHEENLGCRPGQLIKQRRPGGDDVLQFGLIAMGKKDHAQGGVNDRRAWRQVRHRPIGPGRGTSAGAGKTSICTWAKRAYPMDWAGDFAAAPAAAADRRTSVDFLQLSLVEVLRPGGRVVGRHYEINRHRLTGPDVQIFPFQDGVERSAYVKGQGMVFGSEEDHHAVGAAGHPRAISVRGPRLAPTLVHIRPRPGLSQ